jgi:hypothetical protein
MFGIKAIIINEAANIYFFNNEKYETKKDAQDQCDWLNKNGGFNKDGSKRFLYEVIEIKLN